MSENELLLAISDIVGKNTKRLEGCIDRQGEQLGKRIDEVDERISVLNDEMDAKFDAINAKIDELDKRLSGETKMIRLQIENIIEPRLSNIESCYISTFNRYQEGVSKIETLEMNMEVMQRVVKSYGERLDVMTA